MSHGFRRSVTAPLPARMMVMIAATASMTGCMGSGVREEGVRIGDVTLDQFEAGTTTEAWVRAVLGEPTSQAVVEGVENTKVLRYATLSKGGGLASIVTGGSSKVEAVTYFIVTDGVVTRFWADRATERSLLGKPVQEDPGSKAESP